LAFLGDSDLDVSVCISIRGYEFHNSEQRLTERVDFTGSTGEHNYARISMRRISTVVQEIIIVRQDHAVMLPAICEDILIIVSL